MAGDINPPSNEPVDNETLVGAFNNFERDLRLRLHNMLPAKVVTYDRATNLAVVQPLIQTIDTGGKIKDRPQLGEIPVRLDGGGNFMISFPLVPDDLGWIKANDRDISLFLQTFEIAPPNDFRFQNFSSAVFVPDVMTGYTIDGGDADALVIQSLDGTIKITLSPSKITMVHPTLIETSAPDWNHTGNITATGTITGDTDVIAGTISGKDHLHDGSATAPDGPVSDTGAPKP